MFVCRLRPTSPAVLLRHPRGLHSIAFADVGQSEGSATHQKRDTKNDPRQGAEMTLPWPIPHTEYLRNAAKYVRRWRPTAWLVDAFTVEPVSGLSPAGSGKDKWENECCRLNTRFTPATAPVTRALLMIPGSENNWENRLQKWEQLCQNWEHSV